MEIYLLVLLILLNGYFAMSEIALVSARRARLQPMIDRGDSRARIAAELGADPTRFLSTVQIGITSVGMLSGIVGEATLIPPMIDRTIGVTTSRLAINRPSSGGSLNSSTSSTET